MNRLVGVVITGLLLVAFPAFGADEAPKAKSLDELLQQVKAGWRTERAEMQQREADFKATKQDQARKLEAARAARIREEQRSEAMEERFE